MEKIVEIGDLTSSGAEEDDSHVHLASLRDLNSWNYIVDDLLHA